MAEMEDALARIDRSTTSKDEHADQEVSRAIQTADRVIASTAHLMSTIQQLPGSEPLEAKIADFRRSQAEHERERGHREAQAASMRRELATARAESEADRVRRGKAEQALVAERRVQLVQSKPLDAEIADLRRGQAEHERERGHREAQAASMRRELATARAESEADRVRRGKAEQALVAERGLRENLDMSAVVLGSPAPRSGSPGSAESDSFSHARKIQIVQEYARSKIAKADYIVSEAQRQLESTVSVLHSFEVTIQRAERAIDACRINVAARGPGFELNRSLEDAHEAISRTMLLCVTHLHSSNSEE